MLVFLKVKPDIVGMFYYRISNNIRLYFFLNILTAFLSKRLSLSIQIVILRALSELLKFSITLFAKNIGGD